MPPDRPIIRRAKFPHEMNASAAARAVALAKAKKDPAPLSSSAVPRGGKNRHTDGGDDEEDEEDEDEDEDESPFVTARAWEGELDKEFPADTAEGQSRIHFFRRLKKLLKKFAGKHSFHNFATGGACPEESAAVRILNRMFHKVRAHSPCTRPDATRRPFDGFD